MVENLHLIDEENTQVIGTFKVNIPVPVVIVVVVLLRVREIE